MFVMGRCCRPRSSDSLEALGRPFEPFVFLETHMHHEHFQGVPNHNQPQEDYGAL